VKYPRFPTRNEGNARIQNVLEMTCACFRRRNLYQHLLNDLKVVVFYSKAPLDQLIDPYVLMMRLIVKLNVDAPSSWRPCDNSL